MIKEFLLVDDCDENFQEIITFEKEVKIEDITKAIKKVKEDLPGEYTNNDIYLALGNLGDFEQKELFDLEKIYF